MEILDDSDDMTLLAAWNPHEWISNGKQYHDVPPVVQAARRSMLKIPDSFAKNLPPKTMSISQLLQCDLPPASSDTMELDFDFFSATEPTDNIEEILPFLGIPSPTMLDSMNAALGQAWFDGKNSIRTWINPGVACPFWVVTYYREILDAYESKIAWLRAEAWLDRLGKTEEERTLKLTIHGLWTVLGWHGSLGAFGDMQVIRLAALFSSDYLGTNIVDALMTVLASRLRLSDDPRSNNTLIVDTTFASFLGMFPPIVDGTATGPIRASSSAQAYLKKYGAWFHEEGMRHLHLVLHRPPEHWTACSLDFSTHRARYGDSLGWGRPKDFFDAIEVWLKETGHPAFTVADDLPCAKQTDGFNCPVIAVNAIAHRALGDPLWTAKSAKAMRMKAFCDLVKHALSRKDIHKPTSTPNPADCAASILAVNPDFNDTFLAKDPRDGAASNEVLMPEPEIEAKKARAVASPAQPAQDGRKRRAAEMDETRTKQNMVEGRKKKMPKTGQTEEPVRSLHFIFTNSTLVGYAPSKSQTSQGNTTKKKGTKPRPKPPAPSEPSNIGISKAATCAREMRIQVQKGEFEASQTKTINFQAKIRVVDKEATFDPNCKSVQCSACEKWVQGKEPYSTSRFMEHRKKGCKGNAPPPPDNSTRRLDQFGLVAPQAKPKRSVVPVKVAIPCPGLSAAFDKRVGEYLESRGSIGGGGRAVGVYSEELFQKEFLDLTERQRELVYAAQHHDHTWRNDVTPGIMATFAIGKIACLKTVDVDAKNAESPPPCDSCRSLFTSRAYQNAINKPQADPKNLRFDNNFSLERRYVEHVLNGNFKNDTVFNGIIQAKVLAKDREIKGVGKQNFKHNEDVDAVFSLIHAISPRAYREISKHIPLRTERSLKLKASSAPRFPIGIQDETYGYAHQYCKDYGYPLGAPLSLSVDDTKLHAALRPLYNGPLGKWFIVGTTGEPIEVPDADALNATLDELEKTAEMATKLRLWILQIPLPNVPPLVLAIMPLGPKVKGDKLAEWQITLMKGLISRGFRVTSSGGDGAAVERTCQRLTAAASKVIEYRIKHPDPDYPDIIVTVWELNGNVWVEIQDAKHGLKTFRNNASSGARGLVLGNVVVYFEQIYGLAMDPNSPMYPRDVKENRDRMDDPAAARLFSAATLAQAAQDPEKNLGLVVYLLVFGDFIDAYQSRTMSHHERAKIAIRTHIFLQTWRRFLSKAGYAESRHFISKEAFAISEILVNGLLGLIFIHRDHLGAHATPLLPWFNASEPNEHTFASMRDISKDFTFQEAVLMVPKMRTKMQASVRTRPDPTAYKKQASGYCHTYFTSEDIDFALLSQYPTDVELSKAYQIAVEENDCLWTLLGIHPAQIDAASPPKLISQPAPDPAFEALYLDETELASPRDVTEQTAAEEVQQMIDNIQSTVGLSRAEDEQLDACVMASVALSMDQLARIEDLPESDPERFAEIQREIAHAMATQPAAFISLLQGMATTSSGTPTETPPSSRPLVDVSSSDLEPLVALRWQHQTKAAKMGVRTYKASGTYTNPKTGVVKDLTERQRLAQAMGAIVKRDYQQSSSTTLLRKTRFTRETTALAPAAPEKTGNAANAAATAAGRSKEVVKRRRTVFARLKLDCLSTVAEAGIGNDSVLEAGSYGFVITGRDLVLARVLTMYTKSGGKAGPHSIAHRCDTIGTLSYLFVQTYEHNYRRLFKNTRRSDSALGAINRFAHLPSNSFLAILPIEENEAEGVKVFSNHVEVGPRAHRMFQELTAEKELVCKAVASLNTVRRKGKVHINLADMPEDDGVAE
ncbi:hypothetical protein DFH06DRAFT_1386901 [Mycena polygramma]|nr:hypothetical protein DFH06DRAFT_1386901 [Mycena polygramma]